ncbi:uncharacterized protein LOC108040935 [Drosophila rhopaloa]|uniref:Uncharacterized protein LOC108040935 n=1 Tax=Drosophila rhopaloa TaxID=1041015 RepID=A0A6P4ELJ7_DRORH|nr:uncharacterized protein LOC108040935 [Drosophila rhopaloa]
MAATRVLLIFQLLACLMLSTWCCQKRSCQAFMGWNDCFDNGIKEPKLPPRDNACCGPHCVYTAPNPPGCGPCNRNARTRCLLDTHCTELMPFTFVNMSDCDLDRANRARLKNGFARLLSFPWNNKTCLGMNKKCGINCCCRENCPTLFCKF